MKGITVSTGMWILQKKIAEDSAECGVFAYYAKTQKVVGELPPSLVLNLLTLLITAQCHQLLKPPPP
jgi:hypothetical protein